MKKYRLVFTLQSDATFGRGDGVAGVVDDEVQHDEYGLPYLGGRTLKGLLGAECADILYALEAARPDQMQQWRAVAERLFGRSGGGLAGESILHVGAARLPDDLRLAIARDIRQGRLCRAEVLETLTALRRQTAMDPATGAPLAETLRTMRVILRKTVFASELVFCQEPTPAELALLAACVKAFRHAGTGRNRGRGRLLAQLLELDGQEVTEDLFVGFRKAVGA